MTFLVDLNRSQPPMFIQVIGSYHSVLLMKLTSFLDAVTICYHER